MDTLSCVDALCALDSPYHEDSDSQRLFDEAMREIVAFHVMNTPGYRQWLARHNIPADAANIDSWSQLPPIFADYFKQNLPIGRSGV
ncbi:acyl-protein synthase, partial [Klebsiella michiganensis]